MIISDNQLPAFKAAFQSSVQKELVEHCRKFAPKLCEVAGDSGLRQVVSFGLQRAEGYSLCDMPQVRFYIEMMLLLGSEFDTDPQFSWATETLCDDFSRPHVRGLVLHRDLMGYLARVMGPQQEYMRNALERFLHVPPELPKPEERGVDNLRVWLGRIFPEKAKEVTNDQLARVAAEAVQQANEFDMASGDGMLAGIMLIFGHGVTDDPLYPWISRVLRDTQIISPEARVERLWAKLRTYGASAGKYLSESA